jgi:heme A synthase
MTDNLTIIRPVPRWVRVWAILTLLAAVVLLILGGFVTSFRAGMADPVWPTEPWYLLDNYKLDAGYLIEHIHRIFGFLVGGLTIVLVVAAWRYEPNKLLRLFALAAVVFLVLAFGAFHGAMRESWETDKSFNPFARTTGIASLVGAGSLLLACGVVLFGRHPGRWARAAAGVALIFVMIQGLLGGLRVFLNELVGTDLAATHGVFAQVTFCVLVAVVIFAAPRRIGDPLPNSERSGLLWLTWGLVALLFVQLIWAVIVRHQGSPLAQRLHMLTAFVITGIAVWLAVRILNRPVVKARFGGLAFHLLGILALQLLLGVEAYMGKFAAIGPEMYRPPMERTVTVSQASIRTGHQLVGTGLLAAAVALALRAGRRPLDENLPAVGTEVESVSSRNLQQSPAPAAVS